LILALVLAGCGGGGGGDEGGGGGGGGGSELSGQIAIEGSSTVQPISQAAAERFGQENPDVRITVGGAGTGDGFEAFCAGETQISDASRPIEAEEIAACEESGTEFIELQVALDGISVVVNPENDFADAMTIDQLNQLWEPDSQVNQWSQLDPSWPADDIALFGPGTESGTFDFFTEFVNGEEGASRTDYQASEDDNVLVEGVAGDPNALGYFGFSYYQNNQERVRALSIDGGDGPVEPTVETIASGEYPLSRPLFIYVSVQALEENPALEEFVTFYLAEENLNELVEAANYVPQPDSMSQEVRQRFEDRVTGVGGGETTMMMEETT
jgi:phosphate transport system substrate-binding protein